MTSNSISSLVLILFLNFSTVSAFSQTADVQAGLIFGCTKYIEWPSAGKTDHFIIAVTGDGKMLSAIETLATSKKVKGRKVIVRWHDNLNAVSDCHLLYVGEGALDHLEEAIALAHKHNILIVSSREGSGKKGAGLNFILKNNRPAIELNRMQIEKANLRVSSQLVGMAISVD